MYLHRSSIFGALDLFELALIITVSLASVWVVPDWILPWKTMQLQIHMNQVFLNCIAQPITSSRFALSMCVLLIDSAAVSFQYGIWSGYVGGMGLDLYTGVDWKERAKFGIVVLLFLVTMSRALDSRVETKAASLVREFESHRPRPAATSTAKHPFGVMDMGDGART